MTDPRTNAAKEKCALSETTQSSLEILYKELKYSRRKTSDNQYIEKGVRCEEDALDLYSISKGKMYRKNTLRIENDYITGEPDIFDGSILHEAEHTIDLKCSWDIFTFPFPSEPLNKLYLWQGQGYMKLTGATRHTVAYCLVNAPASLVEAAIKQAWWKLGCPSDTNESFIKSCIEIEKNMIFDRALFDKQNQGYDWKCPQSKWRFDIPASERLLEFSFSYNQSMIDELEKRVPLWRDYISKLDQKPILT